MREMRDRAYSPVSDRIGCEHYGYDPGSPGAQDDYRRYIEAGAVLRKIVTGTGSRDSRGRGTTE